MEEVKKVVTIKKDRRESTPVEPSYEKPRKKDRNKEKPEDFTDIQEPKKETSKEKKSKKR